MRPEVIVGVVDDPPIPVVAGILSPQGSNEPVEQMALVFEYHDKPSHMLDIIRTLYAGVILNAIPADGEVRPVGFGIDVSPRVELSCQSAYELDGNELKWRALAVLR